MEEELSADELEAIDESAREEEVSPEELAAIGEASGEPLPPPASARPFALADLSGQQSTSSAPELATMLEPRATPAPSAEPQKRRIPAAPELDLLDPEWWKSKGSAAGNNLAAGFLKQGWDEFTGGVSRAKDVMPGATYRTPLGGERPVANNDDLYRASRDGVREQLEIANEQHPVTSFVANLGGDLASDAIAQALGVPVASQAYQGVAGAVSGLLGSDAELSSGKATPGSAASAAASTALGGTLGYIAPKVGERVAKALPGISAQVRQYLEDKAIGAGNRALLDGGRSLANKMPTSGPAVLQAIQDRAIQMFGTSRGAFDRLEVLGKDRGRVYADILERLEKLGVQGPNAEAIAQRLTDMAEHSRANTGSDKAVANLFQAEADNARTLAPAGFVMPETGAVGAKASNLSLSTAENVKRDLQAKAKWGLINDTLINDGRQDVARVYRKAIEDSVEEAGLQPNVSPELAQLTEDFLPTKQQLARTLEAREAAKVGAARSGNRSAIGLPGYIMAAGQDGVAAQGLTALAVSQLRQRGASTVAEGAYLGSRAANAIGRFAAEEPGTAKVLGQIGSGLMSRQVTGSDWLQKLMGSNPEALGEYGPVLASSMERGPEAFAAADYVLSQKDPAYRQKKEAAQKAANGKQ